VSQPRPEHAPKGDPCHVKGCGIPAASHRKRARARGGYFKTYNRASGDRHDKTTPRGPRRIIALDGEGYTLKSGAHRYTYMAACDADGLVAELRAPQGVKAEQVWRFLLSLPKSALLVGFSLGYDRTKWVESWPDPAVWRLVDPERRQGEDGPLPVSWAGYKVNLVATRLSVREKASGAHRTVWDVWRFFQSSFVKALSRWKVGTEDERALIEREKARRGSFHGIGARERRYCQLECRLLARLTGELLQAHEDEGLKLRSYFGPGSTASVILAEHGEQRTVYPRAMQHAVMCGYFGGRFETSRVGPVRAERLYQYDIASAYPAAMTRLPCLCAGHGKWVHRTGDAWAQRLLSGDAAVALCRFVVDAHKDACDAWGPLPHRLPDGNILFPQKSAGGWAWDAEVAAALELHPGVRVTEAWMWEPSCDCPPPFAARITELYERRLQWGKGARGLVLKLALNSLYGKSAQRVGKGKFRCMVRAGLITSMTRASLLRAVAMAHDPWNVLELATDSVLSKEPLPLGGTGLGSWESKPWPGGVFLLRPGLRIPLTRGGDIERTAARGVGVKTLHENRRKVLRAWGREPMAPVTLRTPSFFHGAKLSVRASQGGEAFRRDALYGRWSDEKKTLTFSPKPKRAELGPRDGQAIRLLPWELPTGEGCASVPYGGVEQSALADDLDRMRELEDDQPEQGMVGLL